MLKNSVLVKEFSYEDDKTVDFSVDPLMYEKLGLKKAKKGDENEFDLAKLHEFQLNKDIAKIRKVKGSYKARSSMYLTLREGDPYYKAVAGRPALGADANFRDLLPQTAENSWRATSVPYGVIAHKRYVEYLENLPKGPSEEEILDKLQRKMDNELWDKIQTGKLEPTRRELRQRERAAAEKAAADFIAENVVDLHKEERNRKALYKAGNFIALRKLPTLRQHNASLDKWHKGIHYPFSLEKGFPIVVEDTTNVAASSTVLRDRNHFESFTPAAVYSGARFTGKERVAEAAYWQHMSELNYDKAGKFLRENERQMVLAAQRAAEEKEAAERSRRRVGAVESSIADRLTLVKMAAFQKEHAFVATKDEAGGAAARKEQEGDSDNDSSSSEELDVEAEASAGNGHNAGMPAGTTAASSRSVGGSSVPMGSPSKAATDIPPQPSNRPSTAPAGRVAAAGTTAAATGDYVRHVLRSLSASGKRSASVMPIAASNADENTVITSSSDAVKAPTPAAGATVPAWQREKPKRRLTWRARLMLLWAALRHLRMALAERWEDTFATDEDAQKDAAAASRRRRGPSEAALMRQRLSAIETTLIAATHPDSYLNRERLEKDKRNAQLVPREEWDADYKRKRHYLRHAMRQLELTGKVMSAEAARKHAALKIRLDALVETNKERNALDSIEGNKVEKIAAYVEACRNAMEEEERARKATRLYRALHWYSLWKKRQRKARAAAAAPPKVPEYALKAYDAEENDMLMGLLVEMRAKEKEAENYLRRQWARLTGSRYEEKRIILYSVDDLVLAAQGGKFRLVLDIVLHDTHPIGPNEVSSDGVTATYATLLMLLKNEVLQDDKNLDALLLTPWQRWRKAHPIFSSDKTAATAKLEWVLEILLHQGGNVMFASRESGKDGTTAMHCAAELGADNMILWLIAKGVDVNLRTTRFKKTPLMIAAEHDKLDTVMLLLKSGAMSSLDAVDKFGWSALHYATLCARVELARVLLLCGAKTTLRNAQGRLAQEEAAQRGRTEMSVAILTFKSDVVPHLSRLDFLGADQMTYSYHTLKNAHKAAVAAHRSSATLTAMGGEGEEKVGEEEDDEDEEEG